LWHKQQYFSRWVWSNAIYLIYADVRNFNSDDMTFKGISKVDGIARVMYDLTAKPPGTTEWE